MWRFVFITLGILLALALVQMLYFALIMAWSDQRTDAGRYYGLSRVDRARFRSRLRLHARLLAPFFWLLSRGSGFKLNNATFHFRGVAGPKGACDEASFERGSRYSPRPEDVFVVTQMKCGTTWMQNVVYQLVTGGQHLLADTGTALYALSPWLESRKTITAEQAPELPGPRPTRLIKTHFPVSLCPYDERAKYIYVVRHPVSCFASCVDFMRSNLSHFAPPPEVCEEWFCSPEWMWWSPWPQHVAAWWQRSQQADNVLFVHFEDMKRDLPAVARGIEAFLGLAPLSDEELAAVLEPCSYRLMSENYDLYEMQVPHLLQDASGFFRSGSAERHLDIAPEIAQRILAWSDRQLHNEGVPAGRLYSDIAAG
jgi:hypothetical protein